MKIAFLTAPSWKHVPLHRAMLGAFREKTNSAEFITPKELVFVMEEDSLKCYRRGARLRAEVVFHRIRQKPGAGVLYLLHLAGYRLVNPLEAWIVCNDKGLQMARFARSGIPHPRTVFTYGEGGAVSGLLDDAGGGRWVVKPRASRRGRGLRRFSSPGQLVGITRGNPGAYGDGFLVQDFIDTPEDVVRRHIRVNVVGEQVISAVNLVAPADGWITNRARGGSTEKREITPQLESLGVRAARAVGAEYTGVDIMESADGGLYVLEANEMPEFGDSSRARLAEYLAGEGRIPR